MSFATNDSATRHSAGVAITAEEIAAGEQKASDDVARYALALGDDALMQKLVAYKAGLKKKIVKANEELAQLQYKFKC